MYYLRTILPWSVRPTSSVAAKLVKAITIMQQAKPPIQGRKEEEEQAFKVYCRE